MSRGRPPVIIQEEAPRKFTRVYEDEIAVETWSFDLNKFDKGPISVDIKYKNGADKKWGKMQNEAKNDRRSARQMKKINERNK
jgi:hypothetical protein